MPSTRVTTGIGVALAAAIVAAVALIAVSSPAPPRTAPSHLVVQAGPPSTATYTVALSLGSATAVTGTGRFDFVHRTAELTLSAPVAIATVSLNAAVVGSTLDVGVPSLASLLGAKWVSVSYARAGAVIGPIALVLRHPGALVAALVADAKARASGVTETTTRADGTSVTTVHVGDAVTATFGLGAIGPATVTVVTARQGELASLAIDAPDNGRDVRLVVTMTGYNTPVAVHLPSDAAVAPLTESRMRQIFGDDAPVVERVLRRIGVTIA